MLNDTALPAVELAKALMACQSVTPEDAGCQEMIARRLSAIGFKIERLRFGEVDNLWARRGTDGPLFVFAGHTDVVPAGPIEQWLTQPFEPTLKDGYLYGRGACDMKGAVAAMVDACERFVNQYPQHPGSIALLLTSDEEGIAVDGTIKVVEVLQKRKEQIDWCIVGEPTCTAIFGDTIKNGRRGSLIGDLTIYGVQGHVAYPQLAVNPIHLFGPALIELCGKEWDKGNEYFQPTSFQVSNINGGTGAENVIPGELKVKLGFRFSPEITAEQLQAYLVEILHKHQIKHDIKWRLSGKPFLTRKGKLVDAIAKAIKEVKNIDPELSTSGGTSDGRFIATTDCEVVEFGLINATIHKVNESAAVADIDALTQIYEKTMQNLLLNAL